jgi:hypothetical protein
MRSAPCDSRLTSFALRALEDAGAQAYRGPVSRSWGLRLALAYLTSPPDEGQQACAWAFEVFWRSMGEQRPQERWGKINAALNGIYLAVGREREFAVVSEFERLRP